MSHFFPKILMSLLSGLIFCGYVNAANNPAANTVDPEIASRITALEEKIAADPKSSGNSYSYYQLAKIYDDELHQPQPAVKWYRVYMELPRARMAKRAKTRIRKLERYVDVDPVAYAAYRKIEMTCPKPDSPGCVEELKNFTATYPDYEALDDALIWLADVMRSRSLGADEPLQMALEFYQKLVDRFPESRYLQRSLFQLAEGYRKFEEYRKAAPIYQRLEDTGSDFMRTQIAYGLQQTNLTLLHRKIALIAGLVLIASLALMLYLIPVKQLKFVPGLRKGLFHFLLFLPIAISMPVTAALLTNPRVDENTGMEPHLLAVVLGITSVILLLNGLVLELEQRRPVPMIRYLFSLLLFHPSLTLVIWYVTGLLPYVSFYFVENYQ